MAQYDPNGNVTESIDGDGNTTLQFYDADGNLTKTVDPDLHTSLQFYDADGNVTKAIDGAGITSLTMFDGDGNITASVDGNGHTTLTQYDGNGNVTQTIDPDGHVTKQFYDAAGNMTLSVDANSVTTLQAYDGDGRITKTVNGDGFTIFQQFDGNGQVTATVDGDGHTTLQMYDGDGNVTASVDANGKTTQQFYDGDGNVTETIDADGHTTLQQYDADGRLTKIIDADGHTTQQRYDGNGNVTASIDGLGHTSRQMFDGDGNVTASVDANGFTTGQMYDGNGNVTASIDGLGHTSKEMFDGDGNVTASVDANGNTTLQSYDADNRLTKTINAAGQTVLHAYDLDGNVTQTIDIFNKTLRQMYDPDERVTESIDGNGFTTRQAFDGDGNVTQAIDADGHTTLTSYDGNGNVIKTTDGNGHTTQQLYDGDGRVTASIDGAGATTRYAFDQDGNRTQVIDPAGNTSTMVYDGDGLLMSQTDPLGNITGFTYDAAGNKISETSPNGSEITYAYDSDNREVAQTWYDTMGIEVNSASFVYDGDGNELSAQNANGTYTMSYDANGRLTNVQVPNAVTLSYTYDNIGNQTSVTDSFGGVETSSYNLQEQLVSRTYAGEGQTLRIDYTYTDKGQVATLARYSDLAGLDLVALTTDEYDGNGKVTSIENTNASAGVIDHFTYAYDGSGNVSSEVDNGTTTSYTYDANNQLTGASGTTYSYDSNGNRSGTGDVTGTGNQLLSDGTNTYTYDLQGNEVSKSNATVTWTYGYDNKNELTSALETTTSTGATLAQIEYKYDVFGNMIERDAYTPATGTVVTKFAVDGWNPANPAGVGTENFNVLAVLNSDNTLQTRNLYGDGVDQLLARIDQSGASDAAGTYWTLSDHLGSVRDVVNDSGTVQDSITYDVYGNITSETNSATRGMYSWTGRQVDVETGLQYNRARWYDAGTGRWISQDPMGFDAGDSNLYRYVKNAPTTATDPSGLQDFPHQPNDKAGPNDRNNVYINVKEESEVKYKNDIVKNAPTGDPKAVPISIELIPKGQLPAVTRNIPSKYSYVGEQDGIQENPWRGLGGKDAKTGQTLVGTHYSIEWVITFSGDPRKSDWGRNVVSPKWAGGFTGFTVENERAVINYFGAGRDKVVREDNAYPDNYIIGNKVYMYDSPGGKFFNSTRLFEVWAESADKSKKITRWYYLNTATPELYEIRAPIERPISNKLSVQDPNNGRRYGFVR